MNAEVRAGQCEDHRRDGASMGPRSDERGSTPCRCACHPRRKASRGPRSDERGSAKRGSGPRRASSMRPRDMLQWGRVRMNADVWCDWPGRWSGRSLQWGRVRMNAEVVNLTTADILALSLQWGRVRMNAEVAAAAV